MNPVEKFNSRAKTVNSLLCVGLDTELAKTPECFREKDFPQFEFNKWIIDETAEYAAAYKPNIAFYEAQGEQGFLELSQTMEYLRLSHPDVFTICDAKRGEIGNTMEQYARAIFDYFGFDACTVNPYLGQEALAPFLARKDKVSIVLCRTSNPGAGEFQDLIVNGPPALRSGEASKPLWQVVAEHVRDDWNSKNNCMIVAGATYPEETKKLREMMGEMTFLVPGFGAQGGDVEPAVRAGINREKLGIIANSARGIIYTEDPAAAAKNLRDEINRFRF